MDVPIRLYREPATSSRVGRLSSGIVRHPASPQRDVASVTLIGDVLSDTGILGHREARRDFHPVHEAGQVVIVRLVVRDLVG